MEKFEIISITDIQKNPYQPRKEFDREKLDELAQSIKENGVIQPIIVRQSPVIGYEILAGERRYRASLLAGLTSIPAVVKQLSDQEMIVQSIIENLQRENLNPIEEARAYESLVEKRILPMLKLQIKWESLVLISATLFACFPCQNRSSQK